VAEGLVLDIMRRQYRVKPHQMMQKIIGYEKDEQGDWRAVLECGHYQHVRHNPPLVTRTWVLTERGRESRLGFELNCKRCDEEAALIEL
jgi:hypothetical protein